MNNYSKTLLALAAVALLGLVAPLGVAQSSSATGFGTQVKLGDVDFRPTATGANVVPTGGAFGTAGRVIGVDFGIGGQVTDDCFYYRHVATATATPINFDLRLTPCQGKAAGTLVGDTDTVEKSTAATASPAATVARFADVNNNGRYDSGDCVYIGTTAVGAAMAASTASNTAGAPAWTIRLTPCGSFAAGTLVFASDSDFTSYGGAAGTAALPAGSGVQFFDADNTGTITTGDSMYFARGATGAGVLFPQFSLRLSGGNAAGAFGTQTKLGDSDFVPTSAGANVVPTGGAFGTAGRVIGVDFGIGGQVTDDCFYYRHAATATATPINFDVRLTPCQGKAAGTLVGDADTVEKSTAATASPAATVARFADVNNNGRYDSGDCVYIGTTAVGAAMAASTASNTAGAPAWTIRLTGCGSFAAGTLVFASDSDFTSYGGAAGTAALPAGSGISFFDADNTATVTSGDLLYFARGATGAGAVFGQHSLRLVGGSGAFGSQLKLGDADFVPVLIATAAVTLTAGDAETDFGIGAQVTDNCFYYNPVAPNAAAPTNFDVRLVPCQGKAAGTMIGDSDTVEKSTAAIDAGATAVRYADVNNNGRYDLGDYVYLTTGGAGTLAASTGLAAWTIRLTPAGSFAAGTLVFAGDADFTSYGAAASVVGAFGGVDTIAYFDADNTATITAGDVVYELPGALPAGGLVPLYAVRLSGTPTASGPNTTGTSTGTGTSTATGTGTSTATGTATSTATGTTTQAGTTSAATDTETENKKTPGFELVALVAALGAALVLVRRKL